MQSFTPFDTLRSVLAPIVGNNIDTDQIVPRQFLALSDRAQLVGAFLHDWRFSAGGVPKPDFILNRPPFERATALLTDANFGCGSSREHAAWALRADGYRALVGLSFNNMFAINCANNGVLCATLSLEDHKLLAAAALSSEGLEVEIDLIAQSCRANGAAYAITTDAFQRRGLIAGQSSTDVAISQASSVTNFEAQNRETAPWLYPIA